MSDEKPLYPNQQPKRGPYKASMFVSKGVPFKRSVPKQHLNKKERRRLKAQREADTLKWVEEAGLKNVPVVANENLMDHAERKGGQSNGESEDK